MIIDTEKDSRFVYICDDKPVSDEHFNTSPDSKTLSDTALLTDYNYMPRVIAKDLVYLGALEEEIAFRKLIEPNPEITLSERTDDWLADRRAAIRKELAELSNQQKSLTAERGEIEQEFFDRFTERDASGTRTSRYTLSAKQDDHYPEIQDRTEFESYMLRTRKLHLLQKRLALNAIREELDMMREERETYETELEEANWDIDTCRYVLMSIAEDNLTDTEEINEARIEQKLQVFQATNSLKSGICDALNRHYDIPGIGITTKLTLNQVKRG